MVWIFAVLRNYVIEILYRITIGLSRIKSSLLVIYELKDVMADSFAWLYIFLVTKNEMNRISKVILNAQNAEILNDKKNAETC